MATAAEKYTVKHVHISGTANDKKRLETLSGSGPLEVSPAHFLTIMCPDHLAARAGATGATPIATTTQNVLDFTILPSVILTEEMLDLNPNFAIKPAWWSKFGKELLESGFVPEIANISAAFESAGYKTGEDATDASYHGDALAMAAKRIQAHAVKYMSKEMRTVGVGDVYLPDECIDGTNTELTASWHDHITSAEVSKNGTDMWNLASFKNIFHSHYCPSEINDVVPTRLRQAAVFMLGTKDPPAGDEFDPMRSVAIILQWDSTRNPHFFAYVKEGDAIGALLRKGTGYSAADRFRPDFVKMWARFPILLQLFYEPAKVDGNSVYDLVVELATALELCTNGELTQPIVDRVQAVIAEHVGALEMPPCITGDRERIQKVIKAVKTGASADKKAESEASAEQISKLNADLGFAQMKRDMLAEGTNAEKLKVMLGGHAAGILHVNGKNVPDEVVRAQTALRTEAVMVQVLNAAVCVDTLKSQRLDWGTLVTAQAAKAVFGGKFSIDWWKVLLKHIVAKQRGAHAIAPFAAAEADPTSLFICPTRLEYSEQALVAAFGLVQFGGREAGSFLAYWRELRRLAASIEALPKAMPQRKGLQSKTKQAAKQAFIEAEHAFAEMLGSPASSAVHPGQFLNSEGPAQAQLNAIAEQLIRLLRELEDGMHSLSVDHGINSLQRGGAGGRGDDGQAKQQRTTDEGWGAALQHNAVASSNGGKTLTFGDRQIVFSTAPPIDKHCPACFAHGPRRDRWCMSPSKCFRAGGEAAHARVDGFDDAACRSTPMTADEQAAVKQDPTFRIIKAAGGGRGSGAQSSSARGSSARSAGGGRGKGGKGKGGKGGKGKGGGKGGKGGRRSF